jgi:hypothetical protein
MQQKWSLFRTRRGSIAGKYEWKRLNSCDTKLLGKLFSSDNFGILFALYNSKSGTHRVKK